MLYLCDPRKYLACKKTGCFYNVNSAYRTCFLCHRPEVALTFWDGRPACLADYDLPSGRMRMVGGSPLLSVAMLAAAKRNRDDYAYLRQQLPEMIECASQVGQTEGGPNRGTTDRTK